MFDSRTLSRIPAEDEALRAPVRAFLDEALRDMPSGRARPLVELIRRKSQQNDRRTQSGSQVYWSRRVGQQWWAVGDNPSSVDFTRGCLDFAT